ncbi:MAG TPA: hypothetical protein VGN83_15715 [Falsiroseomonas sp.]|jgi:hypothetical protein|nr:hypothetical protein [Falsiroseomonas sp.]
MTGRRSCRTAHPGELARAIAAAKAEARAAGLTDAEIDAELAAYNTERRDAATTPGEGTDRTLGGLKPKDLIAEGRDPEPTDGA